MPKPKYNYLRTSQPLGLNVRILERIRDQFERKGWEIEETYDHSLFKKYCKIMGDLVSKKEQELIFDLTERFQKIDNGEYDQYLLPCVKKIFNDFPEKNINIVPMIPPKDKGKSKSSIGISYRFKGDALKRLPEYNKQILKVYNSIDELEKISSIDSVILMVDDFVGTGETAKNAIDYVLKTHPTINSSRIIILSIVSLTVGVDLIESMNVRIYSELILKKGISEYYIEKDVKEHLSTISTIENRIKVPKSYRLGYGKSEALISMIRTPNNTFPIFWYDNEINQSLFPRH